MKKALIALALALPLQANALELDFGVLGGSSSTENEVCKDDPRFGNLSESIKSIDAGTLGKPLQITPNSLITMKPKFITRLKGQYEILKADCTAVGLIDLEPIQSVEIAFPILFTELMKAVSANNTGRINWLIANFKAPDMAVDKAVASLLIPAPVPKDSVGSVAKMLSIKTGFSSDKHKKKERITESFVLLLDVYRAMGGTLSGDISPKTKIKASKVAGIERSGKDSYKETVIAAMALFQYDVREMVK